MTSIRRRMLLSILLIAGSAPVHAQATFPDRPIRFVVGYPAGQSVDLMARTYAAAIARELGQNVIVDNKPGANGIIGAQDVKGAKPDGYTMLVGTSGQLTINPSLYRKLPYDTARDFMPVAILGRAPVVLVAHPSFPASSLKELIVLARTKPGDLNYASGGSGITAHLAMELFQEAAGIKLNHIPYKGSPAALNDVMGGQVPMMMDSIVAALPHIRSGKLKALGVTSAQRHPALADVPTLREQGLKDFEVNAWSAIVTPAGTPAEVVAKVSAAAVKAGQDPAVQKTMQGSGVYDAAGPAAALRSIIDAELPRWALAVQKSGAQAD